MKYLKFKTQPANNKLYLLVCFTICILFLISQIIRFKAIEHRAFMMDELVDTQISVCVSKGYKLYSNIDDGPYLIRTPLLTYIISLMVDPSQDSFGTSTSARKIMWLFSIPIILFTYIASIRFKDHFYGIITVLLLCCFTTFLERSFRIRTDLLSTLFSMPALVVLSGSFISGPLLIISGFFLGLAFLTTQKAIYFIVSFYATIIISRIYLTGINMAGLKKLVVECSAILTGLIIPISILILYIFSSGTTNNFFKQCFFHAMQAGLIEKTYSYTWNYLAQSLQNDIFFWVLGIAGIFVLLFETLELIKNKALISSCKIKTDRNIISMGVWSITILFFIIHHEIKFPYVFINIAPTLSICGSLILVQLLQPGHLNAPKKEIKFKLCGFSIVFFLLLTSVKWHHSALQQSSILQSQKAVMTRLDNITKNNDAVFDGIGIAVTRKKATPYSFTARWYNERRADPEFNIIETIKRTQPKALINNYRLNRLQKNEIQFLENHFVHDWANIHVVGKKITHIGPKKTKLIINLLASTRYAIVSELRKNITLNGNIPKPVMFLPAGNHEIVIKGKSQDILLKYSPAVSKSLPAQIPFNLFPSY